MPSRRMFVPVLALAACLWGSGCTYYTTDPDEVLQNLEICFPRTTAAANELKDAKILASISEGEQVEVAAETFPLAEDDPRSDERCTIRGYIGSGSKYRLRDVKLRLAGDALNSRRTSVETIVKQKVDNYDWVELAQVTTIVHVMFGEDVEEGEFEELVVPTVAVE